MSARGGAARVLRAAARRIEARGGAGAVQRPPAPEDHPRALDVFRRMHLHRELTETESRYAELVDYFGWETGHKAPACKRWFFHDDPRQQELLDNLGIEFWEYAVMHQYSLFHRYDPQRHDLFWIYDELVARLEALGGPQRVSVLDFGCGLGQIGLGFALDGYHVVSSDHERRQLDFARFAFAARDVPFEADHPASDRIYYDSAADGREFGVVVEWAVMEHIPDVRACAEAITAGLVPGGVFVTTTLAKDWTPELRELYERDAGDAEVAAQLFAPELEAWVHETFAVHSPPNCIAKLLVKR